MQAAGWRARAPCNPPHHLFKFPQGLELMAAGSLSHSALAVHLCALTRSALGTSLAVHSKHA